MKEKAKILRIRPFNMANFSASGSYAVYSAIVAFIICLPAMCFLGLGVADSSKTEDGTLDYQILKRRLNRIVLPISLVLFVVLFWWLLIEQSSENPYITLWGSAGPTIGMYCSLIFWAALLDADDNLYIGRWLFLSLLFPVLLFVVPFFIANL